MSLINCEINLILTWPGNCVLTDIITQTARNANPNANPPIEARKRTGAQTNVTLQITDIKFYVPVVTLSTEDDNKLFRTIKIRI